MKPHNSGRLRDSHAPTIGPYIVLFAVLLAFANIPYGLDTPEPIAPYLNDIFPTTSPQSATSIRGWRTVDVLPKLRFSNVLTIEHVPGSNYLCVAERGGKIWFAENHDATEEAILIADLSERVNIPRDGGFMGMTFHPEFGNLESTHFNEIYASYNAAGNKMRISRFSIDPTTLEFDPESEFVLIEQNHGEGSTHFGGSIAFGPDGFLYIPIGDAENRMLDAQTIDDNLVGGILRIDVDMDPTRSHAPRWRLPKTDPSEVSGRGYWIPNDNPFVSSNGDVFEEYFTIGHRNPWKLGIDSENGRVWVSEVGHLQRDEFNVLSSGGNYGWYMREGSVEANHPNYTDPIDPPDDVLGEIMEPAFDDRFGVVSGGVVYRGQKYPSLQGKYIAYAKGIVALEYDPAEDKATSETIIATNAIDFVWAFGRDIEGEIYFIEGGQNQTIKTIEPIIDSSLDVPVLLSETGAFTDMETLEPAPGFIHYTLRQPFWSDGAEKYRWVAIPNDGTHDTPAEQVEFSEDSAWKFPPGTVVMKHFEMPLDYTDPEQTRRLETRFLVVTENDNIYGLSYKWDETGTDATLLSEGMSEFIPVRTPAGIEIRTWQYPDQSMCFECHTTQAKIIGPNTRQLNGDLLYTKTNRAANQIATWNHLGIFSATIDESDLPDLDAVAIRSDSVESIEHAARSYLDSNCAYCHNPGGVLADRFDARISTPLDQASIVNGNAANSLGITDGAILVPGDTSKSIMYQRVKSLEDEIAMPPLAKGRVDSLGVKVIEDWILSLGVQVASFSPAAGLPGAGITIEGSRLDKVTEVRFSDAIASFSIESAERLTAIVPNSAQNGPIQLITLSNTTQSTQNFEVLESEQTAIEAGEEIPHSTALLSTYPNPFHTTAHISFSVGHAGPVKITVYDINGTLVKELLNQPMPQGMYEVSLDATDLASGVYYVHLGAGLANYAKAVTVIK